MSHAASSKEEGAPRAEEGEQASIKREIVSPGDPRFSGKDFFSSSDPDASSDDEYAVDEGVGILPEEAPAPPGELSQRLYTILVAGTGFLADSYDLFVINIVLLMMKQNESYGPLTPDVQTQCSLMAIVGAIVGQLLFGKYVTGSSSVHERWVEFEKERSAEDLAKEIEETLRKNPYASE
jgi:hypothetical protein